MTKKIFWRKIISKLFKVIKRISENSFVLMKKKNDKESFEESENNKKEK